MDISKLQLAAALVAALGISAPALAADESGADKTAKSQVQLDDSKDSKDSKDAKKEKKEKKGKGEKSCKKGEKSCKKGEKSCKKGEKSCKAAEGGDKK